MIITSRLLPGVKIADCTIALDRDGETHDNRDRFRYHFDFDDGREITGNDLKSGCGGCDTIEAFQSLFTFLQAAIESYRYNLHEGDKNPFEDGNADLFDRAIVEWAYQHSNEIVEFAFELENNPHLIEE